MIGSLSSSPVNWFSCLVISEGWRFWANVGPMLVHCLRRWPSIVPTLGGCSVFAGKGQEGKVDNVSPMLCQCWQSWANIQPALGQCSLLTEENIDILVQIGLIWRHLPLLLLGWVVGGMGGGEWCVEVFVIARTGDEVRRRRDNPVTINAFNP